MYLVQQNHIRNRTKKEYEILRLLCRLSKNLYNVTNYTTINYYEANGTFLKYESAYHLVKENENFQLMPSQVAQHTMKMVDKAWISFFHVLKQKQAGSYNRPLDKPHFLPKNGYFVCIFPKDSFKVEGNQLRLSIGRPLTKQYGQQYLYFGMPKTVIGHAIKEIRLIPRQHGLFFDLEYIYLQEPIPTDLDPKQCLAIDLGLGNFATCTSTNGTSFIIEGQGLKSYNRWWNKQKAKLQSQYDIHGIKFGKKMARLLEKRRHIIRNFMAQAVHQIIQSCIDQKLGQLAIGELKGIKQHGHLGKKNNQHFQAIPYGLFKQKLQSKCAVYGIQYTQVNEAYTSQTCHCCGRVRKANRVHRGLYRCDMCKTIWNADINGSINIGKKVASEAFTGLGSSGCVNHPQRITLVTF